EEPPADVRLSTTRKQGYVCGIDIGTTTLVVYLYRGADGRCLGTISQQNKQSAFGDDVISRIQAVETLKALPCCKKPLPLNYHK
ncbi:MAG: hypothetical protein IKM39_02345, partial [Clostridia bacterium]|nr:hypothetical protein [Clostridia bacterium]